MAGQISAVTDNDEVDHRMSRRGPSRFRGYQLTGVAFDSGLWCLQEDVATISDSTAAWLLLEEAEPCLTGDQRTLVFVELGCGEHYLAMERILKVAAGKRFALSAGVHAMLKTWLIPHVGSLEERRLRLLQGAVEAK